MHFSHPLLLWLFLLLPLIGYRTFRAELYLGKVRQAFTMMGEKRPTWRLKARLLLPVLAASWTVFGLAGPAVEIASPEESKYRSSLVLGLDVSKSMLAEDVVLMRAVEEPFEISNRLNLGRRFFHHLIERLENQKTGLFYFAGRGIEIAPLTRDHGFLRYILRHSDTMEMTASGSNLGKALETARGMLRTADVSGRQAVVLVSDGEDIGSDDAGIQQTISFFADEGIRIFCVGTGENQPVHIPIRKKGMTEIDGFYKDMNGNYLQTKLEEDLLKRIALETGGVYVQVKEDSIGRIARELLQHMQNYPSEILPSEAVRKTLLDLSPFFLFLGLFSYTAYFLT